MFPGESQTVLVTHSVKILAKYQQILTKKLNQSSQPRDANAAMTPTLNGFPQAGLQADRHGLVALGREGGREGGRERGRTVGCRLPPMAA